MTDFNTKLENYASLSIKKGVNLQKGQILVIAAPIHSYEFVRVLAEKAYEAGAHNVHVEWSDEQLAKLKLDHAPMEAIQEYPWWHSKAREELAERGAALLL